MYGKIQKWILTAYANKHQKFEGFYTSKKDVKKFYLSEQN